MITNPEMFKNNNVDWSGRGLNSRPAESEPPGAEILLLALFIINRFKKKQLNSLINF